MTEAELAEYEQRAYEIGTHHAPGKDVAIRMLAAEVRRLLQERDAARRRAAAFEASLEELEELRSLRIALQRKLDEVREVARQLADAYIRSGDPNVVWLFELKKQNPWLKKKSDG